MNALTLLALLYALALDGAVLLAALLLALLLRPIVSFLLEIGR